MAVKTTTLGAFFQPFVLFAHHLHSLNEIFNPAAFPLRRAALTQKPSWRMSPLRAGKEDASSECRTHVEPQLRNRA
jgi:hypothetical protein